MPRKGMKWSMDPKDFVSEVEGRLAQAPVSAGPRGGASNVGESLLRSLGPEIEKCLPEAKPEHRPKQSRNRGERVPSNNQMLLDVIKTLDRMSDDLFALFYVELSKEFERRYGVDGWCDRVLGAVEGRDVLMEYDLQTQELPQFPGAARGEEAIASIGDLI